jgi:hypothetical protein
MASFVSSAGGALVCTGLALAACNVPVTIEVGAGPFEYEISATQIQIPDALRDTSTTPPTLRAVTCTDDAMCPQFANGDPAIRCVNSACDPDPFAFDLATDVIDLSTNPDVQRFGDHINSIAVTAATYSATANGLLNPVGPTGLYWGPESAAGTQTPGVVQLGTVPVLDLSAQPMTSGDIALDASGVAVLSDHLLHVSRRFRVFARPTIDVNPGGPLPAGSIHLSVQLRVRVQGQLVR